MMRISTLGLCSAIVGALVCIRSPAVRADTIIDDAQPLESASYTRDAAGHDLAAQAGHPKSSGSNTDTHSWLLWAASTPFPGGQVDMAIRDAAAQLRAKRD